MQELAEEARARHYTTAKAPAHIVHENPTAVIEGYTFTPELRQVFLITLAETGRIYMAARAIGIVTSTVSRHRKLDAVFDEQCKEAFSAYADTVRSTIQRRALEGDLEPIIGRVGRDQDGVIAYRRRYSDNLLAMEARRIDPEYRERAQVDHNVKVSGVLVVAAAPPRVEDWGAQYGGQQLPTDALEGLPGVDGQVLAKALTRGLEVIDATKGESDEDKSDGQ